MDTAPTSLAEGDTRRRARRGLAVFFAVLVPLSAVFQAIIITTGDASWILALMWSPAAASVVARLALREGFADVSFRFGGRRTWKYLALAPIFPIAIGLIAYAIAWTPGLARFAPQPLGLVAPLVGDSASPLTIFVVTLALAATVGTVFAVPYAAGEEIGWRGYMLTRLIGAGVPRPILASGVIWGLWHVPLILAGMYVAGSSPVVAAVLFMVTATSFCFVIARVRLETGSIWPAIALHAAWNSIIQSAFGAATTGVGAALWVGEAGFLTALVLVVAAVIFSHGHWTIRRVPDGSGRVVGAKEAPHPRRRRNRTTTEGSTNLMIVDMPARKGSLKEGNQVSRYGVVLLSIVMMAATALLAGACGSQGGGTPKVGKMQRESKSVDPKNAQSARAQLKMGAGELNLTGGADKLMEGDFSYNVPDWKPRVSYDVSGEKGELVVKQGSANGGNLSGGARNEWDIGMNDQLPTDLVVRLGAGESNLDLDSLTLTGVDLRMGAGKTTVDLSGDYARDFDASIEGGVGQATVLLPSEIGVKAKAEGGLGGINAEGLKKVGGAYVNDAYGESDTNLSIDVTGGVGEINLKVV